MEVDSVTPDEIQAQEPVAIRKRSRKRNITTFVVVCALNAALLVLLWTQLLTPAQHQSQSQPGSNTSSTSSLGDINSPLIGKPAPDFTLPVLDGNASTSGSASAAKVHLADFKGKPVILNFWAAWCAPCNDEAPFLQKSWPSLKSQGIVFIGIDGPEKTSDALKFMQKYGITYPNVQDTVNGATAIDYGATGFPETIFIDRNGVVVAKWAFPLNQQGLQLEMAKLAR